jgi:methionyl-tRNA formyltransferase
LSGLVFFGLDGAFSTIALAALSASELRPRLVIRGVEASSRGPRLSRRPARGLMQTLRSRLLADEEVRGGEVRAASSLTAAAHALGIEALETSDANQPAVHAALRQLEPDVFVIAGFSHLLAPSTLALARRGGLNVHPGRLPEERGPAPLFWALKRGRNPVTVTIHALDAGEDSGDVVSAHLVPFAPGIDGQELLARCAETAAPHLIRAVRAVLAGDVVRIPQPRRGAGRCPRPTFADGKLDAGRPAAEVFTFVAACARHHSLWAECAGDRFFIAEALSFDPDARMGFDFVLTGDRLILRCATGVVELRLKDEGALFSAEYAEPEAEPR